MFQGLSWGYSQASTLAGGTASELIHRLLVGAVSSPRASPERCSRYGFYQEGWWRREGEQDGGLIIFCELIPEVIHLPSPSHTPTITHSVTTRRHSHWEPFEGWLPIAFIVICVSFKVSFTSLNFCGQALEVEGRKCCQKRSNKIGERGMYISSKL